MCLLCTRGCAAQYEINYLQSYNYAAFYFQADWCTQLSFDRCGIINMCAVRLLRRLLCTGGTGRLRHALRDTASASAAAATTKMTATTVLMVLLLSAQLALAVDDTQYAGTFWASPTVDNHGRRPTPKSGGGTKSENYWFKKPIFLKPSKTSKVQILGVLVVFICPAIYSTNQI